LIFPAETGEPGEEAPEGAQVNNDVPEERPSKSCVSYFGSFTAKLEDGMVLSLSTFGENGTPDVKKPEPEPYVPPNMPTSPSPAPKDSPSKGKRDKSREKTSTPDPLVLVSRYSCIMGTCPSWFVLIISLKSGLLEFHPELSDSKTD
jgi:hypothetical protein